MIQPTIRSGIHCRGCGIGLDPYWRFCPVCGQQNLGY
jgi:rRNA maturation endonuclease Nob1